MGTSERKALNESSLSPGPGNYQILSNLREGPKVLLNIDYTCIRIYSMIKAFYYP